MSTLLFSLLAFLTATLSLCAKSEEEIKKEIEICKSCIEKNDNKEEIWRAKFSIGECYEQLAQWDHALYWYLEAYQENPNRPIALRKIATYYRLLGKNELAYIFAKHGSRLPASKDTEISDLPPFYDYQFDEELSIAAYYTRFKSDGFDAANDLVLHKDVPSSIKDQAYRNMLFYVSNLKNARYLPITIDLPFIEEGFDERYHPMNPSIQKTQNGYEVICRTVNYTQTGAKIFNTIDPEGRFRTRNFLIRYDKDFNLLSQLEITEDLPRMRTNSWISANIKGLDDCRIFNWNGERWFTCTTSDTNPTGNFQISLCKLEDYPMDGEITVETLIPLKGSDLNRCEKNWLPFIKDNQLYLVYAYDPLVIYKPDLTTGECQSICSRTFSHDFSRFRGSASPIVFDNGYLILVHEIVFMPNGERKYLHRFLYLDLDFSLKRLSKPFIFLHQGVEFCCGMTLDHADKDLILTIGVEDNQAYLCYVDLQTLRGLLEDL